MRTVLVAFALVLTGASAFAAPVQGQIQCSGFHTTSDGMKRALDIQIDPASGKLLASDTAADLPQGQPKDYFGYPIVYSNNGDAFATVEAQSQHHGYKALYKVSLTISKAGTGADGKYAAHLTAVIIGVDRTSGPTAGNIVVTPIVDDNIRCVMPLNP